MGLLLAVLESKLTKNLINFPAARTQGLHPESRLIYGQEVICKYNVLTDQKSGEEKAQRLVNYLKVKRLWRHRWVIVPSISCLLFPFEPCNYTEVRGVCLTDFQMKISHYGPPVEAGFIEVPNNYAATTTVPSLV